MPSRYIRDGLLESPQVERAGDLAEVLFVRLMLVADDYGRADGRLKVIANKCWPNGGPDHEEIERRLQALEDAKGPAGMGLVVRYEAAGQPYLWIPKFGQRTRAKRSKFPDPPQGFPQDDPQPADIRPADAGQVSDKWRAADGHPQARSRSSTRSYSADAGHVPDTRQAKPMLPSKALTATQQLLEESKRATANAAPPPPGLMDTWKKPADHFEPIRGKGEPATPAPPLQPPREPGDDEGEDNPTTSALDNQAGELGMVRMSFETDDELAHRITARRALG